MAVDRQKFFPMACRDEPSDVIHDIRPLAPCADRLEVIQIAVGHAQGNIRCRRRRRIRAHEEMFGLRDVPDEYAYVVTRRPERIDEVRADESGPSRHEDLHSGRS